MPWSSEVRKDWEVTPLKTVATLNATTLSDSTPDDEVLRYVDISAVNADGTIAEPEVVPFGVAPSRARRVTKPGDTLVSTVRTYLRAVATVTESHGDLIASTGFAVVTPGRRMASEFLSYWLRSTWFVDEVCARSVGVSYPATNASEVGSLPVAVPPLPTQRSIADFLDRKTAAIDALIEKKQKLLDLLAEKRTAMLQTLVTGGRDPETARFSDADSFVATAVSGEPVYRRVRLDRVLRRVAIPLVLDPDTIYTEIGVRSHGRGVFIKEPIRGVELGNKSVFWVQPNVLVFNIVFAWEGAVATTSDRHSGLICSHRFPAYDVASDLADLRFMKHYFTVGHGRFLMNEHSPGAAGRNKTLRQGSLMKEYAWLPDRKTQADLASRIDSETREFLRADEALSRQVEKLREYRQALITAAVTGQIDVEAA